MTKSMSCSLRLGWVGLVLATFIPEGMHAQETLTRAIQAVAGAAPNDLAAAESAVRQGRGTAQQKILSQQAQIVRQNNDAINRRATLGEIDNATYQTLQRDFDRFNGDMASRAAESAGLKYGKQVSPDKPFAPGTDSDYIFQSLDPDRPVTPQQIKQAKDNYNSRMNEEFGTRNVDYAKKLDTDLMANAKGITPKNFERIGNLNNDPYFRTGAADYEAKKRALERYRSEVDDYERKQKDGTLEPETPDPRKRPPPPEITPQESKAYADEMIEMANKKSTKIDHLREDAVAARKSDPARENWNEKTIAEKTQALNDPNRSATSKELDAELITKQQKQAKYLDRLNGETQRLFDEQIKPFRPDAELPAKSKISAQASDRSVDLNDPKKAKQLPRDPTIEDIVNLNRRNAATSNALEDHLMSQAIRNNAEVRAGVASVEPRNLPPSQRAEAEALRRQNLQDAAELGRRLDPSQQNELIDGVRRNYGDGAAKELTAEMRRLNTNEGWSEYFIKRVGGLSGALDKAGKSMLAVDILNAGQTVLDILEGRKTLREGAEEVGDQVTGGMVSYFRKMGDLGRGLAAVEREQRAYDEEWIIESSDALRDAGVGKDERLKIMAAQRRGDEAPLTAKLDELRGQGLEVKLPERKTATVESDDSFGERLLSVPLGILQSIGTAMKFAGNTGINAAQLPYQILSQVAAEFEESRSESDKKSMLARMGEQLRALYRDPATRKMFPESYTEDEVVFFMEANVGRGLKPLDGLVTPPPVVPPAPPTTQVPPVIGYPMTSASQIVRDYQLTSVVIRGKAAPDAKHEGRVYYQEVEAGSVVALFSEVPLYYYDRAPQSVVKVPDLVGMTKADAEGKLAELKLVPQAKATEARPPRTAKRQEVAKQTPAKDTEVLTGQTVSFEYYAGIPVGRYVGLTKDQAFKKIKEDQLVPKVSEGENETENVAERFNIYQQTPQPGEYVWFDDPVEALYYKAARGFQEGDGKLVDARFAAAAVSDGAAPEANLKSAGPRTFIMYNSPRNAGGKETQTTLGWQIRKFPEAAGAKQLYDMMTTPLKQARSVPPGLRVKNDIGATSGALSMDLKTDRNQASSQMNFRIYREVFFISYGRVEPVSGQDFSGEADKIMKKSVELIDLRFPPE